MHSDMLYCLMHSIMLCCLMHSNMLFCLMHSDMLCGECVRQQYQEIQLKHRLDEDNKAITKLMKVKCTRLVLAYLLENS